MLRRRFRQALGTAAAALALCGAAAAAAGNVPQRVVSMNVCTDQLAMLLAAPGQLHSVSYLASQPGASAMAEAATTYAVNHGLAEEIFLMEPDLVVAGTFTTRATVSMLRRLGFRVEEFPPETSFDDVRASIRRMGAALGRERTAEDLVRVLDDGLEQLKRNAPRGGIVATYSSNSYTAGKGSLADAVIVAAGFKNLGTQFGIVGAGRLPLEVLVLSDPDIVTTGTRSYDAPALAQQNFVHPAYRAVLQGRPTAAVPEPYWICGGPFTLLAAHILQDAAKASPATDSKKQR